MIYNVIYYIIIMADYPRLWTFLSPFLSIRIWCTRDDMLFQGTKLISHRAWTGLEPLTLCFSCWLWQHPWWYTVCCVSSLPCISSYFPTSIFQHYIPIKVFTLKLLLKTCPWGIQATTLQLHALSSPSIHLLNFYSDPKGSFQKVVYLWNFQASPFFPQSWYTHGWFFVQY